MKRLILIITMMAMSSMAQARGGSDGGILLSFNAFMYQQSSESDPGGTGDSSTSIYDLKIGNVGSGGLYLGGIYSVRSHSGTGITSEDGKALGASIGYMGDGGFFIQGHYYLTAENGTFKKGSGYQADFGYLSAVSGAFQVGVELTYRNITYKEAPGLNSYTSKELFPMLTAAFSF